MREWRTPSKTVDYGKYLSQKTQRTVSCLTTVLDSKELFGKKERSAVRKRSHDGMYLSRKKKAQITVGWLTVLELPF
jgi:hypothetical protein